MQAFVLRFNMSGLKSATSDNYITQSSRSENLDFAATMVNEGAKSLKSLHPNETAIITP